MFCAVFGVILLLKCFTMDMCTSQTEKCNCRGTSVVAFPEESSSNHASDSEDAGCCNSIMNTENQSIILNGRDHNLKTSRNSTDQMTNINVSFQIGDAIKTVFSLPSSISDSPSFFKNRQLRFYKNHTNQILVKNSHSAEQNSPREERNRTSKIKLVGNNLQSDPFIKIGVEFNSSQNNLIKLIPGDTPHKARDKETVTEELKSKPSTTATNELPLNDATKKELSVTEFGSVPSFIGNFKSREEYIPEEKYELIDLTLSTPFETFGGEIDQEDHQLASLRDNNINDYHQISKNDLKRFIRKQQTGPQEFYQNPKTFFTSKYENPENPSEKHPPYQEVYFNQKLPRIARRHLNMLAEDPYENYLDEKLDFPHENYYKTMNKENIKPATYNYWYTMSEPLPKSLDITDKIYMTAKSSSEMHRSNRAESSTTKNEMNRKHKVNSNNEIDEDNKELMIIKSEVDSSRAKMKKSAVRLKRRTMEKYSHRNLFKMFNQVNSVTKGNNEDAEEALIITSGDDSYSEKNKEILVGEPDDNGYTKTDYLLVKMKNPTVKPEQGYSRETLYRRGHRMLNRDSNILTDEDGEEILIEVPDDDGYTEINGLWVKKKESTVKPKQMHKGKKLCKDRKTMQKKKYEVTKDAPEDNREVLIKGLTNDEYTKVDDSWAKIKKATVKPKRMHLGKKFYPEKKTMQNEKHRFTKADNTDDEGILIIVPDNDGYTEIDDLRVKMKEITVKPEQRHKQKYMNRFQKKIVTNNSHPAEENGYEYLQKTESNVARKGINDLITSLNKKPLRRKTREHKSSPSYDAKSILYSPENLFSEITNDLKEKLSFSNPKALTTEDISHNSHNSKVLVMKSDETTTVSTIHGNFSRDFPTHESFLSRETVKMNASEKIIGTRAGNFSKEAQNVSVISKGTTLKSTSTPTSNILTTVVGKIMNTSNIYVNFRNAIIENKTVMSNVSANIETTEKIPSTSISDGIPDLSVSMEGTTQDILFISSSSMLFKTEADENKDASTALRNFSSSYSKNETFSSTDIEKVHSSENNIDVHIGKNSNETQSTSVSSEGSALKFLQNETFSTADGAIFESSKESTETQHGNVFDKKASVAFQSSTLKVFTKEIFSSADNTKTQDGNISNENASILSESTTKEVLQNEIFSNADSAVAYKSETTLKNNSQEIVNESGSSNISLDLFSSTVVMTELDESKTVSSLNRNISSVYPKSETFSRNNTVNVDISQESFNTELGNFSDETKNVSVISEGIALNSTSIPTSMILTTVVDEIMNASNIYVNFRNSILENKTFVSNVSENFETAKKMTKISPVAISDGIENLSVVKEGTKQAYLSISHSSIPLKTEADQNMATSTARSNFRSFYPKNGTFSTTDIVKVHSSLKNIHIHAGKNSDETQNASVSSEGLAQKFLQNETFSRADSAVVDTSKESPDSQHGNLFYEKTSASLQGYTLENVIKDTFSSADSAIFDSSDLSTESQNVNISEENIPIISKNTTLEVLQKETFSTADSTVVYRSETTLTNISQDTVNLSDSSKISSVFFSPKVLMTDLDKDTIVSSDNTSLISVYPKSETFSITDTVKVEVPQESYNTLQVKISNETQNMSIISEGITHKSKSPPTTKILTTVVDEVKNASNIFVNFRNAILENQAFITNVSANIETTEKMTEIRLKGIFDGIQNLSVSEEDTTQRNLSISPISIALKTEAVKNTGSSSVHSNFSSFYPKNETFSTTDILKVHSSEKNIDIHAGKNSDETQNASVSSESSAMTFLQNETFSGADIATAHTSKESTETLQVSWEKASAALKGSTLEIFKKETFLSADSASSNDLFESSDENTKIQDKNISKENISLLSEVTAMEVLQNENFSRAESAVDYRSHEKSEPALVNISKEILNVSGSLEATTQDIAPVLSSSMVLMTGLGESTTASSENRNLSSVYPKSETFSRTDTANVDISQGSIDTLLNNISDKIRNLSVSTEGITEENFSISPSYIRLKTEADENPGASTAYSNFSSFYSRNVTFSSIDIAKVHSSENNILVHTEKNSDETQNADVSSEGSAMTFLQNEMFSSADSAIVDTSNEITQTQQIKVFDENSTASIQGSTLEALTKETFSSADKDILYSSDENTEIQDRNVFKENASILSEDIAMEVLKNETSLNADTAVNYRFQGTSETMLENFSTETLNVFGSAESTTLDISSVVSSPMVLKTELDESDTASPEYSNLTSVYPKSETFSRTDTANNDIAEGSINTMLKKISDEIQNVSVPIEGTTQANLSISPSSILLKTEADNNTDASTAHSNFNSLYPKNETFSSIDIVKVHSSEENIDAHAEKNSVETQNAPVSSEGSAQTFFQNKTFSSADSSIVSTSNEITQTQQIKVFDENSSILMQGSTLEVLTNETFSSPDKVIVYSSDNTTEIQDSNISKENASILSEDIAMEVLQNETSSSADTAVDYRSQKSSETTLANISHEILNVSGSSESTTQKISSVVSSPTVLQTELDERITVSSANSSLITVYPKSETFSRTDTVNVDISQESFNTLLRNISDETQNVSVSIEGIIQGKLTISPGSILLKTEADNNTETSTAHGNFSSFIPLMTEEDQNKAISTAHSNFISFDPENETFSTTDIVKIHSSVKNIDIYAGKNSDETQNAPVSSEGSALKFLQNETLSRAVSAVVDTSKEGIEAQNANAFDEKASDSLEGSTLENLTKDMFSSADSTIVDPSDENPESQGGNISKENASILSENTTTEIELNVTFPNADSAVVYRSEIPLLKISKNSQQTVHVTGSSENSSDLLSSIVQRTELDESTSVSTANGSLSSVYPKSEKFSRTDTVNVGISKESFNTVLGNISDETRNVSVISEDITLKNPSLPASEILTTAVDEILNASNIYVNFRNAILENKTFMGNVSENFETSEKITEISPMAIFDETENITVVKEGATHTNLSISHSSIPLKTEADQNMATSTAYSNFSSFYTKNETFSSTDIVKAHSLVKNIDVHTGKNSDETQNASVSSEGSALKVMQNETLLRADSTIVGTSKENTDSQHGNLFYENASASLQGSTLENVIKDTFSSADSAIFESSDENTESQDGYISKENASILSENTAMEIVQNVTFPNADSSVVYRSEIPLLNISKNSQENVHVTGSSKNSSELMSSIVLRTELDESTTISTVNGSLSNFYPQSEKFSRIDAIVDISQDSFNTVLGNISDETKNVSVISEGTTLLMSMNLTTGVDEITNASNINDNFRNAILENKTFISNVSENLETAEKMTEISPIAISDGTENLSVVKEGTTQANLSISHSSIPLITEADQNTATSTTHSNFSSLYSKNETFSTNDIPKAHSSVNNIDIHAEKNSHETQNASVLSEGSALKFLQNETFSRTDSAVVHTSKESTETQLVSDEKTSVSLQVSTLENLTKDMFSSADSAIFDSSDENPESQDGNISKENPFILSENTTLENLQNVTFSNADSAVIYRSEDPLVNISKNFQETLHVTGSSKTSLDLLSSMVLMTELDESTTVSTVNGSLSSAYPKSEIFSRTDSVIVDVSQESFNTLLGNISDEIKNVSVISEGTTLRSTSIPTTKILTTVVNEIMNTSNIYVNFRNAILDNKTFISNVSENFETTEKMTEISPVTISDETENLSVVKKGTTQANLSISRSSIPLMTEADQNTATSTAHSDFSRFFTKNETFSRTDIVKVHSSVKNIDIHAGKNSDETQNASVSSEDSALKFLQNETFSTADSAVVDTSKEGTEIQHANVFDEKVSVSLEGSTLEVLRKETFSSADNGIVTIEGPSEKVSDIQLGNISDETLNVSSSLEDSIREFFSVSPSPLMTELDEWTTVFSFQSNFSSNSPKSETFSSTQSFNVGISEKIMQLGNISNETRNVSLSSEGTSLGVSSISPMSMEVPTEPDGNKNVSSVYDNFTNDSSDNETSLDQDSLSTDLSENSTEFQTRNIFEETLNASVSLEGATLEISAFSSSSILTLETANFSNAFSSLGNFSMMSSEENAVLSTIALNSDKSQITEVKIGNISMFEESQTVLGTVEGTTQKISSFISNSVVLNTEQGEVMNASSSHVNVSRLFLGNNSFSSSDSVNMKEKITNTHSSNLFNEAQNASVSSEMAPLENFSIFPSPMILTIGSNESTSAISSRVKFNNDSLESDSFSSTTTNIETNKTTNIRQGHITISDETEKVSSTVENTTQAISSVSSMVLTTESDEILSSSYSPGHLSGVFFKSGKLSRTDILNTDLSEKSPKIQPENISIENGNFSVSLEDTTLEINRMHPGFNVLTTVPSKVTSASSSHVHLFTNSSDSDLFSSASFENVRKNQTTETLMENISISDETQKESVTSESKTLKIQPISPNFKAYITRSNESIIIHFTHEVDSMIVEVNNTDGQLTIFISPIIKKDLDEITNSSSYGNISDLVYKVSSNTSNLKNEINSNVVETQSTLFPVTIKVGEFNFRSTAKLKFIPSKASKAEKFTNELKKSTRDSSTQKILSFSSLQNETFFDAVSLSVNSTDQTDNVSKNIEISNENQNLNMESENDAFSNIYTLNLQPTHKNIETDSGNIHSPGEIEGVYSTSYHIYGIKESIPFIKSDADNMNFGSSDAENSVNLSSIANSSTHKNTDEFAINPMFTTYLPIIVSGKNNVVDLNSNSLPVVRQSMPPLNDSLFTETEGHIGISNAHETMSFFNGTSDIQKKETSVTSFFDFNWNDTVTNSFVNSTDNEYDEIVIFCNVTYDDIISTSFSEKYLLLNTNEPVSFLGSESDIDSNQNAYSPKINNSFLLESSSISSLMSEIPPVFSTLFDSTKIRNDREENYTKVDFRRYNPTRMVYSPDFSFNGFFSENTLKTRNEFTVDENVTSPSSIDITHNLTSPEYRSAKTSPVLYEAFINSSEVNAEYNHSYDEDLKPSAFKKASTEGHSNENTYLPKKNKLFSLMMEFAKKENITEFQQIIDEMCENRKKNTPVTKPSTALFVFPSNTIFMRKKREKVNVPNVTLFPSSFYSTSLFPTHSAAKSAASKVNAEDEAHDIEKKREDKELIQYLQIVSIEKPRIGNAIARTDLNYKDHTKEDEGNSKFFLKNTLGNYQIVNPKLSNKEFTKTENLFTNKLTNRNIKYIPNVQIKVPSISTKLNDTTSAFSAVNPSDTAGTYRIIGENLESEAWPWMVSIYKASDMTFICAGSLIEKRFVISAAHCFIGLPNTKLVASIGKLDKISKSNDGITIGETVVHQGFDASRHCNDIAILRLTQPASQFMTIGIPEFDTAVVGENTTLLSWGDTKYVKNGRPSGTNKLQTISHLPIQSSKECRKIMKGNINTDVPKEFEKQTICAGIPDGSIDACLGNPGGPLMHESYDGRWNLLGIVSFGYKCGLPGVFGLYTRVSYYSTWIWDVIDSFKV